MVKEKKIKREKTKFEKNYMGITTGVVVVCLCIGLYVAYGKNILNSSLDETATEEVQSDITLGITSLGNMTTYIDASGTVSVPDTTSVSLPIDSVIDEVYVQEGSLVNEGDVLYSITNSSLQSGLQKLEEELETALDEASGVDDEYTTTKIKATQDGRVKLLVAEEDEEVSDLLLENDQLAMVSTAGTMYVDIESDALNVGDSVVVSVDNEEIDGTVISLTDGVARIQIDSDEYDVFADAQVLSSSGILIGQGQLQLTSYINIQAPIGTIKYVYVDENDEVEQGDVLFKVTVSDLTTEQIYDDINDLYEQIATMNEYIKVGAVVAPYDGIVGTVSINEGSSLMANSSAIEIKPASGFEVTISVDEDELQSIYLGQSAEVTFADEYVLSGEISHINYNAVTSSSTSSFTVYVSLYECEEINNNKVLPGMVGDVNIILEERENVVRVPLEAVFEDSNGKYVMLFTGDIDISQYEVYNIPSEICYVETGMTSDLYAEVISGLEGGQQVIMVSSSNSDTYGGFMNRDFSSSFSGGSMPNGSGGSMPQGNMMPSGGN